MNPNLTNKHHVDLESQNASYIYISISQLHLLDNIINWEIGCRELNAVIGANKSGKSFLAKIISGKVFNYQGTIQKKISSQEISFSDYSVDNSRFHYANYYYQQRYNSTDISNIETIKDILNYDSNNKYQNTVFNKILPKDILTKTLIEISSGENRKVLILKNIFTPCKVYILDNPFTGLDKKSIQNICDVFTIMTQQYEKTVILLLNKPIEHIAFNRVIQLKDPSETATYKTSSKKFDIYKTPKSSFDIAFQIEQQVIKVKSKILIHEANWTIKKGEKWVLKGANGSGKTTLMSLLNADNPMGYNLGLTLFDKKRGTGESIWDIKSKIGFVSPEIQLFWDGSVFAKDIILSGFSNTLILNRKLSPDEQQYFEYFVSTFNLQSVVNEYFSLLSSGEKRMVMVVRALVNNPPLLILDEPFQGLDQERFTFLYDFLSNYVDQNRTLVQIAHFEDELLPCVNHKAHIINQQLHLSPSPPTHNRDQ